MCSSYANRIISYTSHIRREKGRVWEEWIYASLIPSFCHSGMVSMLVTFYYSSLPFFEKKNWENCFGTAQCGLKFLCNHENVFNKTMLSVEWFVDSFHFLFEERLRKI